MSNLVTLTLTEEQLAAIFSMAEAGIDDRSNHLGSCTIQDGYTDVDIAEASKSITVAQNALSEIKKQISNSENADENADSMEISVLVTLDITPNNHEFGNEPKEMTRSDVEWAVVSRMEHLVDAVGIGESELAGDHPMSIDTYLVTNTKTIALS